MATSVRFAVKYFLPTNSKSTTSNRKQREGDIIQQTWLRFAGVVTGKKLGSDINTKCASAQQLLPNPKFATAIQQHGLEFHVLLIRCEFPNENLEDWLDGSQLSESIF